jgi:hypothetical protein
MSINIFINLNLIGFDRFEKILGRLMELLERDHFFSILNRIGLHVGLKLYFFQTDEIIEFGGFFKIIYISRKVTVKMCNYCLQIGF